MDALIMMVRELRVAGTLGARRELAEKIVRRIQRDLGLFVFGAVGATDAPDVLQETLNAIVTGIKKFTGSSDAQVWAWCYAIARNKISDHYRAAKSNKEDIVAAEELWQVVELSAQKKPMSPGVRHDLQYVLNLLAKSKPECYDILWQHYIVGLKYAELAPTHNVSPDGVRMKIGRCLDEARKYAA